MRIFFLLLILMGVYMSSCQTSLPQNNIEDEYLSDTSKQIEKDNFFVLTGCSGGGKSTLLTELERRGYAIIPEPGRQIVKEQEAIGGRGLPWKDLGWFLELALSRYIFQFNQNEKVNKIIFFDRGIIDAVQLTRKQGSYFKNAANKFRYNKKVFMLPPWEEIYKTDSERKHSFKDAVKEYEELLVKNKNFGYEIFIVPKDSVEKCVDFILSIAKP